MLLLPTLCAAFLAAQTQCIFVQRSTPQSDLSTYLGIDRKIGCANLEKFYGCGVIATIVTSPSSGP